jgi:hypothetical protein
MSVGLDIVKKISERQWRLVFLLWILVHTLVLPGLVYDRMEYGQLPNATCHRSASNFATSPLIPTTICQWIPACLAAISSFIALAEHCRKTQLEWVDRAKLWIRLAISFAYTIVLLLTAVMIFVSSLSDLFSSATLDKFLMAYNLASLLNLVAVVIGILQTV